MATFWVLLRKDLTIELRSRELVPAMLLFAALVLVIFNFALDLSIQGSPTLAAGVIWVSLAFAGTLGLGRGFIAEKENGTLEALTLCPADRGWIYLARTASNALFILVVEVVVFPLYLVLFNVSFLQPGVLGVALLGTLGLAAVGTLFGAMAANTRAREVMLPLLLLPVAVPSILASVQATAQVLDPGTAADRPWLGLLAAFDAIFLVVSSWLFEFVVEG